MKIQIIPVGKNKTIAVEPLRTLWIGVEESDARGWMKRGCQDDKIAYTDRVKRTWVAGANPIGAPRETQTHQESFRIACHRNRPG